MILWPTGGSPFRDVMYVCYSSFTYMYQVHMYLHVHVSLENNSTFFNMYIAIFTLNIWFY